MQLRRLFTEDDAVSSAIGVVLMVAVTVVLAAAVGTFALGLAGEKSKPTPSASMEVEWGTYSGDDTVDITMLGGDGLQKEHVSVEMTGTTIWDADSGTSGSLSIYDGKEWSNAKIKSGDTLGIKEDSNTGFQDGDTVVVLWNNGQKSQILGDGTLQK